jgi:hypothetical protein
VSARAARSVIIFKPRLHIQRIADVHGLTPKELCQAALAQSGFSYKIATVDTLIWRACATGGLDSRTGWLVADHHDHGDRHYRVALNRNSERRLPVNQFGCGLVDAELIIGE